MLSAYSYKRLIKGLHVQENQGLLNNKECYGISLAYRSKKSGQDSYVW
jgi:hypothetical protein